MRAARLAGAQRFRIEQERVPEPGDGEVLVRLAGCGVCASSLPVWEGRPWFDYPREAGAPGHEGWGIEVESGRRVAVFAEGAFAEYVVAPAAHVVPLPDELGDLPFPGEAIGCALNVFARSGIEAGNRVGVVGCGFLGLLLVQLAVAAGAQVSAFSRRESALALARSFGAETPDEPGEEMCDVVVEAAGVQATLDQAVGLCHEGGRLVIAGYHQDGGRTIDLQLWNWRGLDVVNAHERDPARYLAGMRAAVEATVAGRIDPWPLLTHALPLQALDDAFELLRVRPEGFIKAVVTT